MPSRSDVALLRRSQVRVAQMARAELAGWWATIDKSNPMNIRREVEWFFPVLVEEYGNVAATVAGDWYEEIYRELPRMSNLANEARARARARWAIGSAFKGDVDGALGSLEIVASELVRQFGRDTVVQSSRYNGRMFARVPTGPETCAWCLMLASRGFAFHSETAAKPMTQSHYGTCDCEVVAYDGQVPDGYDPDSMYDKYQSVHESGDTDKDVAAKLRNKYDTH